MTHLWVVRETIPLLLDPLLSKVDPERTPLHHLLPLHCWLPTLYHTAEAALGQAMFTQLFLQFGRLPQSDSQSFAAGSIAVSCCEGASDGHHGTVNVATKSSRIF